MSEFSGPGRRRRPGTRRRLLGVLLLALCLVVFVTGVFFAALAAAAALSRTTTATTWTTWGNVGQTFESVNAIFSGLAFAALIVTFWFQLKELREQRLELQMQREATDGSRDELRRSAQAELRQVHMELIKLALNDAELAAVWPEIGPGLPAERNRQYLYANLILQHVRLWPQISEFGETAARSHLRSVLGEGRGRGNTRRSGSHPQETTPHS